MNAAEIHDAISELTAIPYDAASFPFVFLEAFGNKPAVIAKLKKGSSNSSDFEGGVLQRSNIHIATCETGEVTDTLHALKESPATAKAKAKFILATDGEVIEAENLINGETAVCNFEDLPNRVGFFLALAGITTTKQIRENSFDIRATSHLNKLYVELLKDNPEWATADRRPDMNHFMARLIFCFFAEDTNIFHASYGFTKTVETYSKNNEANTHEVIGELFRAMNTPTKHNGSDDDRYRDAAEIKQWANYVPYVNGGLFSGSLDVPKFSKIARSYFIHIGNLDWKQINPDIFGSMIQAVADDEERGSLGMHYTSVPNILKVLNPLFLDDLREKLEAAGNNPIKLLNLKKRMAKIRVFDPACGSGNFLVIAYKEMRAIEAEVNKRRNEVEISSFIPLTNFRGIEINDFPAEIARLALIIAEYQADVLYRGQRLALNEFLPLDKQNWITCGNALRLDWLSVFPPTSTKVKTRGDDLFATELEQTEIDFENEGGETYICGNPPYKGYNKRTSQEKEDMELVFSQYMKKWGSLDYVAAWFLKAALYLKNTDGACALVATNSVCQGGQATVLWPLLNGHNSEICFGYTSFKWSNLASNNAGITVVIVGIEAGHKRKKIIYSQIDSEVSSKLCHNINGYLISGPNVYARKKDKPLSNVGVMSFGNHPYYGSHLIFTKNEYESMVEKAPSISKYVRPIYGSTEVINGKPRQCFWIENDNLDEAMQIEEIANRLAIGKAERQSKKKDKSALKLADTPHQFRDRLEATQNFIAVPQTSSENREYLPCDLFNREALVTFKCFALYDASLWNMALVASKLHINWIAAVCGRLEMRFSYSNTLGWNTFPVPTLTEKNKADLTRCAEDILLARETHFPATIADLYNPDTMPENLRRAHEKNDETLERIYIGRRFKNDTERLEKLFEMYTKMTATKGAA